MRLDWKGALGIAISVVLLWWTLRGESPAEIWAVVRGANRGLLLLMVVAATLVFPLRALRWAVILEPVDTIAFGPLFRSTAIGMMVNNLVPARAGEFARAYAISREAKSVSFSAALGSLAVDRILDATAVAILFFVALPFSHFSSDALVGGLSVASLTRIAAVAATLPLVVLALAALRPELITRLASAVFRRVLPKAHDRILGIVSAMLSGISAMRSPGRAVRMLAYALAMWTLSAFSFWLGFRAVGIEASFAAALFVQTLIAFGVAVPSSPGFFGVFELAGVAGLGLYGVPRDLAVSWALSYHILTFLPITLIGLWYFARLGMHFSDLGKGRQTA